MEDPRDRTERDLAEYEEFVEYESRGLSLLDLMLVLARRKSMIIKITMLFAVGSIIASLLMTKLYVGSARILNPVEKSSTMSLLEQQAGVAASLLFTGSEKGNVYVSMLQSRNVRDRVLDRFAPKNWRELAGPGKEMGMGDLVSEHIGTLTVTAEKDNTLLVSVEYTDQGKVADIANAYVDDMEKLANEFAMTEATKRLNYFEGELANARMSLTRTEQLFREYQEKTGVYMGEAQLTANIQNRINMRGQRSPTQQRISVAAAASVHGLAPLHLPRRPTRPVSYYAFFKPSSVESDHLSRAHVAAHLKRPNPREGRAALYLSYLVLLRVGFA